MYVTFSCPFLFLDYIIGKNFLQFSYVNYRRARSWREHARVLSLNHMESFFVAQHRHWRSYLTVSCQLAKPLSSRISHRVTSFALIHSMRARARSHARWTLSNAQVKSRLRGYIVSTIRAVAIFRGFAALLIDYMLPRVCVYVTALSTLIYTVTTISNV